MATPSLLHPPSAPRLKVVKCRNGYTFRATSTLPESTSNHVSEAKKWKGQATEWGGTALFDLYLFHLNKRPASTLAIKKVKRFGRIEIKA